MFRGLGNPADEIASLRAENERLLENCKDKATLLADAYAQCDRLRAEVGRLKTTVRVNMLRCGFTDAEIEDVIAAPDAAEPKPCNAGYVRYGRCVVCGAALDQDCRGRSGEQKEQEKKNE